jgi:cytochrome c oxidase assembly protein Cox11
MPSERETKLSRMIETKPRVSGSLIVLVGVTVLTSLIAAMLFHSAGAKPAPSEPFEVIKAYLKASYARDYHNAYQYISSFDQGVWDKKSYVLQHGSFSGFALELAEKLAESMEIWVIDRKLSGDRAYYKIGYRAPTADELSSFLFDWDPDKLNALSRPQQEQLLGTVGKMKKDGKMIMIEGQETFDLVSNKDRWKIFLDWASGIKVALKTDIDPSAGIEARFVQSELVVKKNEPFQIDLKIKNRSRRPIVARIIHHIEPQRLTDNIDMIACGALQPLELQPGEVREFSSAYLITEELGPGNKIAITYEFNLEFLPPSRVAESKTANPALRHPANAA